jgi:hypothetical protein
MKSKKKLNVGEWVEVRSKEEILRTLDHNGRLDGMPFMPEMFQFCGQRFRVYKSAHKTCDPHYRSRRIHHAVHLETAPTMDKTSMIGRITSTDRGINSNIQ